MPPGGSLSRYRAVLVPTLPVLSEAAAASLADSDAAMLFGPRTGSKTAEFEIPDGLPPGLLRGLLAGAAGAAAAATAAAAARVTQVASLRPGLSHPVSGALEGAAVRWREWIEADGEALGRFEDGSPAVVGFGRRLYLACWPDPALLAASVRHVLEQGGLEVTALPPGVRLRRRGGLQFAFNYGPEPWTVPERPGRRFVLGGPTLAPQDLACWHA